MKRTRFSPSSCTTKNDQPSTVYLALLGVLSICTLHGRQLRQWSCIRQGLACRGAVATSRGVRNDLQARFPALQWLHLILTGNPPGLKASPVHYTRPPDTKQDVADCSRRQAPAPQRLRLSRSPMTSHLCPARSALVSARTRQTEPPVVSLRLRLHRRLFPSPVQCACQLFRDP